MTEQRIIRPNGGHIILPKRFIDVGIPVNPVSMKGRYQLVKRDAYGIELERTPWFDNLLLTSGLNRMGTASTILGAAIGTDATAPNAAQTGLIVQSIYTTTTGAGHGVIAALGVSPYNNTATYVYRTALGALNGNYSEVGVGWLSGAMFSRALILNGVGSPTSISVTSAQQLDIIYQLSVYPPLVDTSAVVTISGVNYTVTGRAASVNGTTLWNPSRFTNSFVYCSSSAYVGAVYTGAIGAITSVPAGTSAISTDRGISDAYVNNSLQRTGYNSYGLTAGNVAGGIKSTLISWNEDTGNSGAYFQYGFNPVIPKDGTKTLVLHYSLNWAARP